MNYQLLRNQTARQLVTAKLISEIGDFIGLSALVLLAYHKTGILGSAAIFAVRTLPALIAGVTSHINHLHQKSALVSLAVAGAITTAGVALVPNLWTAFLATALLSLFRTASLGVTSGMVVNALDKSLYGSYFAMSGAINQLSQAVGFFLGMALTQWLGVPLSLGLDALSFVAAAAILSRLKPTLSPTLSHSKNEWSANGYRLILRDRTMRSLAMAVWMMACVASLPETFSPGYARGIQLAVVLALFPLGQTLGSWLALRRGWLDSSRTMTTMAAGVGASFALCALILALGGGWWLMVGNFILGVTGCWVIGARTTFMRRTHPAQVPQMEATMVGTNTLFEGVGTLALASLATMTSISVVYWFAGLGMAAVALTKIRGLHLTDSPEAVPFH